MSSRMFERGNKELGGRLESETVWLLEAAERLAELVGKRHLVGKAPNTRSVPIARREFMERSRDKEQQETFFSLWPG